MDALGILLIAIGVVLIVVTWTDTMGPVLGILFGGAT